MVSSLLLSLIPDLATLEAAVGQVLLKKAETEAEFERQLSLIETILANKFPDLTKEMIMQILDLKQMDITKSLFCQEIIQEGRQAEGENLVLRQY